MVSDEYKQDENLNQFASCQHQTLDAAVMILRIRSEMYLDVAVVRIVRIRSEM